ncbi:TPA: hypothetical protein U5E27_001057 [Yersinia enterocolitica]|nr:hypothetical protein [Yersinia enterocolitica]
MPRKMLMRDQAVVFRKSSNTGLLRKMSPVSRFYNGQTSAQEKEREETGFSCSYMNLNSQIK